MDAEEFKVKMSEFPNPRTLTITKPSQVLPTPKGVGLYWVWGEPRKIQEKYMPLH